MTGPWLARIAREAGGLWPEPTDRARVTGPWLAGASQRTEQELLARPGRRALAGANGPSKSDRALAGATCGRQALLWSPRFRRKRARALAGANCGRGAALRLGLGLASIGLTEKRRGQSRAAQRQSAATFTLYSGFFFARLEADSVGRERQRAQAPTRALAGRPSTDRASGGGRQGLGRRGVGRGSLAGQRSRPAGRLSG